MVHSLGCFGKIAAAGRFTAADLYAPALDALGQTEAKYSLACSAIQITPYGLVEKVPRSRRYRLVGI